MPAPFSSDVVAGDDALATQYNNLRKDTVNSTDGHNHDGSNSRELADASVNAAKFVHYAGDYLVIDAGDSANQSGSGSGNLKRVQLARSGQYRIKFKLTINVNTGISGDTDTITGQIYKNGSPVGTLRTHSVGCGATGTFTSAVYSEDIGSWTKGDELQIYCGWTLRVVQADTAAVLDLEIYADAPEIPNILL